MSKKLKVESSTRRVEPKRRLSRWEREKKRRRILEIVILVVIVGVVAAGIIVAYDHYIKPWHQPIVKVNDRVFDMNYFVKMLRLWGGGQDPIQSAQSVVEVIQYHELMRQAARKFDIEKVSDDEIEKQIRSSLGFDPDKESEKAFNQRVEETLKEIGLSRADFEEMFIEPIVLEGKLREYMGFQKYPQDETLQHVRVQAMLLGTEEEAWEARERWEGYWLIRILEERGEGDEKEMHVEVILLDSEEKAGEVADEFDGENFAQLAEEYSLHTASRKNGGDLGWLSVKDVESRFGADALELAINELSEPIPIQLVAEYSPSRYYPKDSVEWLPGDIESSAFDDFAFREGSEDIGISEPIRDTTYWTKGGYWLIRIIGARGEGEEKEMHVEAILLDSEEKAGEVADEFDGENFAQLAEEYSLHSASRENGGDMDWLSVKDVESRFGADALELELNTLSEPIYEDISKQSGYWLIEVLAREDRTLSKEHRDLLSSEAFYDWREEEEKKAEEEGRIKSYLDYEKIFWALEHV